MEIEYLKEFIILVKEKQYLSASRKLFISQSALSRHINALEVELGVPLFFRSTREVGLTKAGEIFLPYAQNILDNYDSLSKELKLYLKTNKQTPTIGIIHNPETWGVAKYLVDFLAAYKEIKINVFEGDFEELQEKFSLGELHIITTAHPTNSRLPKRFIPAGKSRLMVAISENNPLAKNESISLLDLKNEPLFVPQRSLFTYRYFLEECEKNSFKPNIVYQGNSNGINALISNQNGVLIQDEKILLRQKAEGFVLRSFYPEISYIYGIDYAEGLTKEEEIFVEYIRVRCHNIRF